MKSAIRRRPKSDEFYPYYALYVDRVPDGDILETLAAQSEATLGLVRGIGETRGNHRYAPGKWSIKEVMGHVVDIERVFAGRAMHFARRDPTSIPGVDQDVLVEGADFDSRTLASLCDEFEHLRKSNIALFRSFDRDVWDRTGTASECTFSVRSIAYIMVGHEIHHRAVLEERYL